MRMIRKVLLFCIVLNLMFVALSPIVISKPALAAGNPVNQTRINDRIPNQDISVHATASPQSRKLMASLPATYRLAVAERVSPIRNQGAYGTCWAFGALASAESVAMSEGLLGNPDWSEWQMAYFAYASQNGAPTFDLPKPTASIFNQGGIDSISIAMMVRGASPVLEAEAPYWGPSPMPDMKPAYALKNVYTAHDSAEWKTLIMQKGAISIGYYQNNTYYNDTTHAFFAIHRESQTMGS